MESIINELCSLTGMTIEMVGVGEFSPTTTFSDQEISQLRNYVEKILKEGFLEDIPSGLSTEAK